MRKALIVLLGMGLVLGMLAGCGSAVGDTGNGCSPECAEAYTKQATQLQQDGMAQLFALVDVNGDETPEMAALNSNGGWDSDCVFLYTFDGQKAVLLESDIRPGMEGHFLGFFEGKNLFVKSGAATGSSYTFCRIEDSQARSLGTLSYFEMGEEKIWELDRSKVSQEDYDKKMAEILKECGDLTVLAQTDTPNMAIQRVEAKDGFLVCETIGTAEYLDYDVFVQELNSK